MNQPATCNLQPPVGKAGGLAGVTTENFNAENAENAEERRETKTDFSLRPSAGFLSASSALNGIEATANHQLPRKHIPISFVAGRLAVNENTLIEMLDLKDGRSYQAQRKAIYRFCKVNGIEKLAGCGVWPLRQVERAVVGKS